MQVLKSLLKTEFNLKKCKILPNKSFDLARLSTTIVEYFENDSELYNLERLDGKDISPILFDSPKSKDMYDQRLFLHYCGEELGAARLGNRYKVHWETAIWEDGINSCPKESICGCDSGSVTTHDPPLLYDLINDPYEINNLINDSFYENDIKFLQKALNSWVRKTKDKGEINEYDLIKSAYIQ